jgi:hypothetical protein
VHDVNELVSTVFSGLAPLVIEDVADEGERILVRARTPCGTAACPDCGAWSGQVHGYHLRAVADVPVDARRVVVEVRVRRLVCPTRGCRQTFREQLSGVLERYQRRTPRLSAQVGSVVRELAGRAGARVLSALGRTYNKDEHGIAYGKGPSYGDGGPVVVAGVTTGQGGRESRLHRAKGAR